MSNEFQEFDGLTRIDSTDDESSGVFDEFEPIDSGMADPCSTDGCDEQAVAVIREDRLNGSKYCPDCLHHEGMQRGWW